MRHAWWMLVASVGLLVGLVAVGVVVHASGLTGGQPSGGLALVGAGAFVVGAVVFGYGTGKRTGY